MVVEIQQLPVDSIPHGLIDAAMQQRRLSATVARPYMLDLEQLEAAIGRLVIGEAEWCLLTNSDNQGGVETPDERNILKDVRDGLVFDG